jgi:hypothetical protein
MKHEKIRNNWLQLVEKYKEYFLSKYEKWIISFQKLKNHLDVSEGKNIFTVSTDAKKLKKFLNLQKENFRLKIGSMKDPIIYKTWNEFINDEKYRYKIMSFNERWIHNLSLLILYIEKNSCLPSTESKDQKIKSLGKWYFKYKKNYLDKTGMIMDDELYPLWTEFINNEKYLKYTDTWLYNMNIVKNFIDVNDRAPYSSLNRPLEERRLKNWMITHKKAYNDGSMFDINRPRWDAFMAHEKYGNYI